MTKLFPKPLFAVLAVLAFVAIGSCDKDSEKTSSEIQLLSFGPTGANHGDTLRFIGLNLDKVTAIHFTGQNAVVEQADFESQTSTLIKLLVPTSVEKGYVTLKTPQGDIVTKTILDLGVMPTVTNMTTEARPNTNITIDGSYLNWVTSVTFGRNKQVTSFVSQSFEQLVVQVPEDAETAPLVIGYNGTDSGFYATDTLKVTLPVGTAVGPALLYHGENITITGTDLDLVKKVYFTNVSAPVTSFESQSATELVVKVPPTALKGGIKLEAASGVQTIVPGEVDVKMPRATGIAPGIVKHLENITITGTELQLVEKIHFTNASTPVTTFVSKTPTQIVVAVPGAAKKGTIKLEMASGLQTTSTAQVDVLLPAITSFTPNPVDPNDNLTINGTNLDLVTAVELQSVPPITTFVSKTATQIVVTIPEAATNGPITLKVLNSSVTVSSTTSLEIVGAELPPVISRKFWDDALASGWSSTGGWSGGGWGGTKDVDNTSPVRVGAKSVKITYDASQWGSPLQLGGANVPLSGYTHFKISIYCPAAAVGNKIQIVLNKDEDGGQYEITLGNADKWTDYAIPLSSFPDVVGGNLFEVWVKEIQGKSYTIYVDEIGLN